MMEEVKDNRAAQTCQFTILLRVVGRNVTYARKYSGTTHRQY